MNPEDLQATPMDNVRNPVNLQDQLKDILSEIRTLKSEVYGNNHVVSAEVKKLRSEQDIKWRYEGNKIQYLFNCDLSDLVKQAVWALENGKAEYCNEQLKEVLDKIHKRNKHIRIADSSSGGWDTVKQYESNPIASDSEDESRIQKAEGRALKRKRLVSKSSGSRNNRSHLPVIQHPPMASGRGFFRAQPGGFFNGARHRFGPSSSIGNVGGSYSGPFKVGGYPGPCFACGENNHIRRQCPHLRTTAAIESPIDLNK